MFSSAEGGSSKLEEWFGRQTAETLRATREFVERVSVGSAQRALLLTALRALEEKLGRSPGAERSFLPFVHLAPLIAMAVAGSDEGGTPVTLVTTLIFAGFDIIDDEADGDLQSGALPPIWSGFRFSEIDLAAHILTGSLPQLALAGLSRSSSMVLAMQEALAEGILRATAGQQLDLTYTNSREVTAEQVEAATVGKSGEEWAMFAVLGALYAGAPWPNVHRYAGFARSLGTAIQIADDCREIFARAPSRDLAAGTRTLPVALYLERLKGSERDEFLRLLDRARADLDVQREVADRLRHGGTLRECAYVAEGYCLTALECLTQAQPAAPAAHMLHDLIDQSSMFPRK